MCFTKEICRKVGFGLLPILGGVATTSCGNPVEGKANTKVFVDNWYKSEIGKLTTERNAVLEVVVSDQLKLDNDFSALPVKCQEAVMPLLAIGVFSAAFDALDQERLQERVDGFIGAFCGPNNLDAYSILRADTDQLNSDEAKANELSISIEANLGAAGVTVPTPNR